MPAVRPSDIAGRLREVRERIDRAARRSGRSAHDVRLVAVTKTLDAAVVQAACALGLSDFGENYIQEAAKKVAILVGEGARPTWHLIGHLQANKVKAVMGTFAWIHSVDRMSLLDDLARQGRAEAAMPELLLQVNLEQDRAKSTKFGFEPAELENALHAAAERRLPVRGLMTFPPYFEDPERARPYYARLRALREELARRDWGEGIEIRELSMGMSNDFETAIEEGATMVRVGTSLFGARMAEPSRDGQDGPKRGGARMAEPSRDGQDGLKRGGPRRRDE
ncbi:MAG: YggS family pyridoxal phosphate-dependent enzyme [Nitrospirae bacterium]|nr:YggS family pyridoxal phosphate-dependent enzyme [Nitrospirota bacterium]